MNKAKMQENGSNQAPPFSILDLALDDSARLHQLINGLPVNTATGKHLAHKHHQNSSQQNIGPAGHCGNPGAPNYPPLPAGSSLDGRLLVITLNRSAACIRVLVRVW